MDIRIEPLLPPMKYRIVAVRGEFARVLQFGARFDDDQVASIAIQDIALNDAKWVRDNGHATLGADPAPPIWIPAGRDRKAETSISSGVTPEGTT